MAFTYEIAAHPTWYNGVRYRSRLEARWGAVLDLVVTKAAGGRVYYEGVDLVGWSPDFRIEMPCFGGEECDKIRDSGPVGVHVLLAEVKPYWTLDEFYGHPGWDMPTEATAAHQHFPYGTPCLLGAAPHVGRVVWECGGKIHVKSPKEVFCSSVFWDACGSFVQWSPRP